MFSQFDSWAHREASSIVMGTVGPHQTDGTMAFHGGVFVQTGEEWCHS